MFIATYTNAVISKSKDVFWFFFRISEIYIKFGILWKRRWSSKVIYFWNFRLQKARLLKWLKSPLPEHSWLANMLNGPKHCLNVHGSIFVIFFWSFRKKISSKNSVLVVSEILRLLVNILTHDDKYSLSVKASFLRNQLKPSYLKIKKCFLNFFMNSRNLHKIRNTLRQKTRLKRYFFKKLETAKSGFT